MSTARDEAVELVAAAVDGSISEWVTLRASDHGYEADPRELARLAVEALEERPDVLAALADQPSTPSAERYTTDELLLVVQPGRMSGRVTIGRSRLPLTTVLRRVLAGASAGEITEAYPLVTGDQLAVLDQLCVELSAGEHLPTPPAEVRTEWGVRWPHDPDTEADDVEPYDDRVHAEAAVKHYTRERGEVVSRRVGPWTPAAGGTE